MTDETIGQEFIRAYGGHVQREAEFDAAERTRLRRERIATAAMQGLLASETAHAEIRNVSATLAEAQQNMAKAAVGLADALIKKLDETNA